MKQSKIDSMIETSVGTAIGFVLSYFISLATEPLWHMMSKWLAGLVITGIFTIASLIRSYRVRRWFNAVPVGDNIRLWTTRRLEVLRDWRMWLP